MSDTIPPEFQLEMYDFDLPQDRIAQVPAQRRDGSRLMHLPISGGAPTDHVFSDIVGFLRPGDLLVLNDTRVFPARLFARKPAGGLVELLALATAEYGFSAMYGTHRGLKAGTRLSVLDRDSNDSGLRVIVTSTDRGVAHIRMECDGAQATCSAAELFDRFGHMPLPPYIKRPDGSMEDLDRIRYQTVYASRTGAVAAPTAGLHFTPAILQTIREAGVCTASVTLHVGPGTFKPVRSADVRQHDVGTESYEISADAARAINAAVDEGRRIIAVGTTVVRTLEADGTSGHVTAGQKDTSILITPGYRFKIITGMITNFHIPKSSLILLVSALAGRERILDAYRTAVGRGYRFYSYGDSMLIL